MTLDGKQIIIEDGKIKDAKSQSLLYTRYAPYLYGQALRYTKSKEDAQDVLQDTFLTVFENIGQYNKKGTIRAWMTRILINRAISMGKGRSKLIVFESFDDHDEEVIDHSIVQSDMFAHEILLDFIRDLPSGCQMVFNMCGIEGYSYEEAAKILNCSLITCRAQFSKAKNALRKKINDFNESKNENLR
jgi:RNA polymerase sigma-70 factor (ECF subfamily)